MTDQDREAAKAAFLKTHGFERTVVRPLAADASSRSYARLEGAPHPALLMDAPLQKEAPPCPPTADEATRRGWGYNAMARLAGPRLEAFTALAQWLSAQGVSAPKVYAEDIDQGFAVIEDFGQRHLADVAQDKAQEAVLYRQALLLLRPLQQKALSAHDLGPWPLQTYDRLALQAEADLFLDWYLADVGVPLTDNAKTDWYAAWSGMFDKLSPPQTLVLRDYHAQNILVKEDGQLAVIDFQDALIGQSAYDAVSLLEDARRDVDPGLADELYQEERDQSSNPGVYAMDYAILAAQRNMKILGVFVRLAVRDKKPQYRDFLPRMHRHIAKDLDRPEAAPLREWTARYVPALLSNGEKP